MNKLSFFTLLLSCFIFACGGGDVVAKTPEPIKIVGEVPRPTIEWQDYNGGDALLVAEKDSKLLFLFLYSKRCHACVSYAEETLTDECVIKESKDGFVFSKVEVETEEGQTAYDKYIGIEDGKMAVPATAVIATMKEAPGLDLVIAKGIGVITPERLCDVMVKLRTAHREAMEKVRKELGL